MSFYWREAEKGEREHPVPVTLTEDYSFTHRAMRGTNEKHHVRCLALEGKVGKGVSCSIYANRPTPCHNFMASFEDGQQHPRCDQARSHYGLPPLTRKDWIARDFAHGDPAAMLLGDESPKISF